MYSNSSDVLDSSSASRLGRENAKAVPIEDLGLAPMSAKIFLAQVQFIIHSLFICILTVLPQMPLLLAPHDQTLGAFFQGLYQNCLGNLKTNNGLKIFRVEVRCVAAAAPGCTIVIVRPTPGQKEN